MGTFFFGAGDNIFFLYVKKPLSSALIASVPGAVFHLFLLVQDRLLLQKTVCHGKNMDLIQIRHCLLHFINYADAVVPKLLIIALRDLLSPPEMKKIFFQWFILLQRIYNHRAGIRFCIHLRTGKIGCRYCFIYPMIYGILFDAPKPETHHAKKRDKNKDQRCYGKFLVQLQSAKPVSHFSSPSFLFCSVTLSILPFFSSKSNFFRKIMDKKEKTVHFFSVHRLSFRKTHI